MDSSIAYEKNSKKFLTHRNSSQVGLNIAKDWAGSFDLGTEILEVACGTGYPITKELIKAGMKVWAIDSSPTLLSDFSSKFPNIPVACEKIQDAKLFDRKFDAAISIGLVFLLSENDQEIFFKKISNTLRIDSRFLFTAPTRKGKWSDLTTGVECHSLGFKKYKKILNTYGFKIIGRHVDAGRNNYYEVKKVAYP
ncbi:class I SAM-dependent methyltransferase [Psychrosphaera sp. F3M07]|uniref:class I SAM-dependent methyltransferase n=1 Tax=Psychrosphaera sp. F3M07 TaxID=2841560 RepID=UPI001C095241|nr:class I SAM-dependent methyltransferase [Psychrosphaera sp. F3M07]MBU2917604.1 class I SAM-dependent methyltransferase [Psychrosphaera sp. F3M07]